MNNLPLHIIPAVMLLLLSALPAAGQQNVSDYEIYQSFQRTYAEIEQQLDMVTHSGEADSLMKAIRELELKHEAHRVMLDQALYPDTFFGRVNKLKQQTISLRDRLIRMERLAVRVEELNLQVASYERRLERLDRQTDSLSRILTAADNRNEVLTSLVEEYRFRMQQRDEFIMGVVDSLMMIYESFDSGMNRDLNLEERITLGKGSDPLSLIQRVAVENGGYFEEINDLTSVDYLRMKTVQVEFDRMWDRLGEHLLAIYATGEPERTGMEIDRAIRRWNERVTNQMWISLNESIRRHELPIGEVNSRDELFEELNGYVEASIQRSREGSDNREDFHRFDTFWHDRVKMNWAGYAARAGVLGHRQIALIDRNLQKWEETSRPGSNLFVYLFGVCVVVLLVVSLLLFREKHAAGRDEQ